MRTIQSFVTYGAVKVNADVYQLICEPTDNPHGRKSPAL